MEGKRQAPSLGLDIRFFTSPAAEEAAISLRRREYGKLTLVLLREESAGDRFVIEILTNLFHIYTECSSLCKGKQRNCT